MQQSTLSDLSDETQINQMITETWARNGFTRRDANGVLTICAAADVMAELRPVCESIKAGTFGVEPPSPPAVVEQ